MRQIKCPNCGAEMNKEVVSRDYIYCEYCGTKLDLTSFRAYITIEDKAKLKEIEVMEAIHRQEQEKESKNPFLRNWLLIMLGFAICFSIGLSGDYSEPCHFVFAFLGFVGLFVSLPGGFVLYLINLFKKRKGKR